MLKLKANFGRCDTNCHGTQGKGEPWNRETVRGWKVSCVDLLKPIKEREAHNREGGKTRAKWYKRFILYFPDGSWWHWDVALLRSCAIKNQWKIRPQNLLK